MSKDSFSPSEVTAIADHLDSLDKIWRINMTNYHNKLKQYAELLVRVGMNVQPQQPVLYVHLLKR